MSFIGLPQYGQYGSSTLVIDDGISVMIRRRGSRDIWPVIEQSSRLSVQDLRRGEKEDKNQPWKLIVSYRPPMAM